MAKPYEANYCIFTLDKKPAMTETLMDEFYGTYQAAVELCHKIYHETGRSTHLTSKGYTSYYWHRVTNGTAIDRNKNSGVPETQTI